MIRRRGALLLLVLACAEREGPIDPAELAPFYHDIVVREAGGTLAFVDHYWAVRGDSFALRPIPADVRLAVLDAGGEIVPVEQWDACRRGLRRQEVCDLLTRQDHTVVQIEEPWIEDGEIHAGLRYTDAGPARPCTRLYFSNRNVWGLRRRGSRLEVGFGNRPMWKHEPRNEPPGVVCPPEGGEASVEAEERVEAEES